jgi:hypothetical protein
VLHQLQSLELAPQPVARLDVVGDVLSQNLDGHRAPARVQGKIDNAHATLAQRLDQSVGADALGSHEGVLPRTLDD